MNTLIDTSVDFLDGDSNTPFVIKKTQEIPQEWIDGLRAERANSGAKPMGNFHRVASIPTSVYEKWLKEGYDAQNEPLPKTLAKLSSEGLDYFITTDRKI